MPDPTAPDTDAARGPRRYRFPRAMRLGHRRDYQAVYAARTRVTAWPLTVFGTPNGRPYPRLGLAVSRHVGHAVRRNRIKRRLREAFRLAATDIPVGYDLVVKVRPHEPLTLAEYQRLLFKARRKLHAIWQNRATRPPAPTDPAPDSSPDASSG